MISCSCDEKSVETQVRAYELSVVQTLFRVIFSDGGDENTQVAQRRQVNPLKVVLIN